MRDRTPCAASGDAGAGRGILPLAPEAAAPEAAAPEAALVREPDAPVSRVPEAVLHDAWARQALHADRLATTDGEPVTVLSPGRLNHGSGPDFSDARVRIGRGAGALVWAGDVEIHRQSADWNRHRHEADPAYGRVVLHVVLSQDAATGTLRRPDGTLLPELVLLPVLDRSLRSLIYDAYARPQARAPYCSSLWREVPEDDRRAWVRRVGAERLRQKAARLGRRYERGPDPDRHLTIAVFRALGYAPNADAMERLATRLPLGLARSLPSPEAVRALLLGLAGLAPMDLAPTPEAEAFAALAREHALPPPMAPESWRQGGRPANAPRRRLAQAAALLGPGGLLRETPLAALRETLLGPDPAAGLLAALREAPASGVPAIGRARARTVLVNAVLPALALDAEMAEDPTVEPRVLDVLDALPPEADRVTRAFAEAGLKPKTALETQGTHHLAAAYCDEGRCARCAIGQRLFPGLARPLA